MMKRCLPLLIGLVIPIAVLLPPLRSPLEASMLLHMLVVFPLLIVAGAALAAALPGRPVDWLKTWNNNGIPGLLVVSSVLTIWMIPLALDRAVENWWVDAVKTLSLVIAGAAMVVSLPRATRVVQLFFVWNWVGMAVFIGVLYQSLPVRLCSTYLINDQERTGLGMVIMAAVLGSIWCIHVWRGYQRDLQEALNPH